MGKNRKYKKSIRKFAHDQDIFAEFMEKEAQKAEAGIDESSSGIIKKNRHGVPVLEEEPAWAFGISETPTPPTAEACGTLPSPVQKPAVRPVPLKKRLKRYPLAETQLDLHGFTALGAELKTRTFIQSHFREGYFTLRIIVGKGLHSEAGAVLPHIIEGLLTEMKKQGQVLTFAWDKKKKSASGSLIVYLNQFGDDTG